MKLGLEKFMELSLPLFQDLGYKISIAVAEALEAHKGVKLHF